MKIIKSYYNNKEIIKTYEYYDKLYDYCFDKHKLCILLNNTSFMDIYIILNYYRKIYFNIL